MRGRQIAVDVALAAAVLAVAQIAIVTAREAQSVPRTWVAYALGVAMAAPVLFRRRWPIAALYAVGAVLLAFYSARFPGFPPSLVLAVPLYDAVRARRVWWAVPVPVLFLSIGFAVSVRKGSAPLDGVAAFLPEVALAAVAMLLGALMRSRHAYAEQVTLRLREAEADRERQAARLLAEERLRIARELHDTVAHAVTTMTVQSAAALQLLERDPNRAADALTAIRATGKDALAQMRATLQTLRSDEPTGSLPAGAGLERLANLLDAVRAAGLDVVVDGEVPALPAAIDAAAYRIVQEALTNVLRHAGPQAQARLTFTATAGQFTIDLTDDGTGIGSPSAGGHGLIGMRERAAAVHGTLEVGPRPGRGYRVHAILPMEAP
jgi:signal transduction histidine kinase